MFDKIEEIPLKILLKYDPYILIKILNSRDNFKTNFTSLYYKTHIFVFNNSTRNFSDIVLREFRKVNNIKGNLSLDSRLINFIKPYIHIKSDISINNNTTAKLMHDKINSKRRSFHNAMKDQFVKNRELENSNIKNLRQSSLSANFYSNKALNLDKILFNYNVSNDNEENIRSKKNAKQENNSIRNHENGNFMNRERIISQSDKESYESFRPNFIDQEDRRQSYRCTDIYNEFFLIDNENCPFEKSRYPRNYRDKEGFTNFSIYEDAIQGNEDTSEAPVPYINVKTTNATSNENSCESKTFSSNEKWWRTQPISIYSENIAYASDKRRNTFQNLLHSLISEQNSKFDSNYNKITPGRDEVNNFLHKNNERFDTNTQNNSFRTSTTNKKKNDISKTDRVNEKINEELSDINYTINFDDTNGLKIDKKSLKTRIILQEINKTDTLSDLIKLYEREKQLDNQSKVPVHEVSTDNYNKSIVIDLLKKFPDKQKEVDKLKIDSNQKSFEPSDTKNSIESNELKIDKQSLEARINSRIINKPETLHGTDNQIENGILLFNQYEIPIIQFPTEKIIPNAISDKNKMDRLNVYSEFQTISVTNEAKENDFSEINPIIDSKMESEKFIELQVPPPSRKRTPTKKKLPTDTIRLQPVKFNSISVDKYDWKNRVALNIPLTLDDYFPNQMYNTPIEEKYPQKQFPRLESVLNAGKVDLLNDENNLEENDAEQEVEEDYLKFVFQRFLQRSTNMEPMNIDILNQVVSRPQSNSCFYGDKILNIVKRCL